MNYSICLTSELPQLQAFIHEHWKPGHILATNKKLLDFQHRRAGGYHFVLAREDDQLVGILGFIPTRQYDIEIKRMDIWLAIWKSLVPGAGMGMLKYLEDLYLPDTIGAIGINSEVEKIYQTLGWKTGTLNHYYLPNIGKVAHYTGYDKFINCVNSTMKVEGIPEKSLTYINNRYRKHPFYQYKVLTVKGCQFVIREIEVENRMILRIVDIIGELPENLEYTFTHLMQQEFADYSRRSTIF